MKDLEVEKLCNKGYIREVIDAHKLEHIAIYSNLVILFYPHEKNYVAIVKDGKISEFEEIENEDKDGGD